MPRKLAVASILRTTGRIITDFVIPLILLYLIFVGPQPATAERGYPVLSLNMVVMLLLGAGFVIAWRWEIVGALCGFGGLAVFVMAGFVVEGFREVFGSTPLVWRLSLVAALVKPQSFDPIPDRITFSAWLVTVAPIVLFMASWLLRQAPPASATQPESGAGG